MGRRTAAAAVLVVGMLAGAAGSAASAAQHAGQAPGFVVVHQKMKCHSVADDRAIG